VTEDERAYTNDLFTRDDGTVTISGELTFETVPEFFGHTADWLNVASGVTTFDLQGVRRADSAGLALLLEWRQLAQQNGRQLTFVNIPEQVRRIIRISGLQQAFPLQ